MPPVKALYKPTQSEMAAIPKWAMENIQKMLKAVARCQNEYMVMARVYADALDKDKNFYEWVRIVEPRLSPHFLNRLERVGRGQTDQRLLEGGRYAAYLEKLTLSEQCKILDGGIHLLTTDGDSLLVKVDELSTAQIKQVFAFDHIRTLSEQRLWVEQQRAIVKDTAKLPSQWIQNELGADINRHKKTVTFDAPVTLSLADLISLTSKLCS